MEPVPRETSRTTVMRLPGREVEADRLAVEEPLEIRVDGTAVAVTMRSPGHDEELALGFCITEGLRPLAAHPTADLAANVVEVDAPEADLSTIQRSFYTSSSCGVCGKGALEAVAVDAPRVESDLAVTFAVLAALPLALAKAQAAFALTGGLHATGLFSPDGTVLCVREDVGRHNAMDKVIGWALAPGCCRLAVDPVRERPPRFELVQKAAVAGCPVVVAVGAPSSLAVELAGDRGVTLCGFVRDSSANVYTAPGRVVA
jgi:FdhD protein